MLQSGARWGRVGHPYWRMCEIRPSPGFRESLLRDVTFDMDPMADRNHWKRTGKGIQGRVAVPFTGKLAGE